MSFIAVYSCSVYILFLVLIDNKAKFFCLRGKALNVLPYFDPRSVECLSKAIKLDPSLIEAWNELGESYWKDKKIEEAQNCFQGAIAKVGWNNVLTCV